MGINWGYELAVVIVGLVVVFAVLLILVVLCELMGNTFKNIDKNKKAKLDAKTNETKEDKATSNSVIKAVANATPVVESGITDDVVAAISAAIACIMGSGNKFAVKSINRVKGSRPAWNMAGIAENTRPF
ncbi:MAG: OadG family transporter subunit [Oscillospiraceae bacterium]